MPAVAVTINTNDFGDVSTMAILAQVNPAKRAMNATASGTNANLTVVDSSGAEIGTDIHGTSLADFAVTCGNLTGVTMWAPVQDECSLGTLADNIDQTLFLDKVYINSLEFGYTTGANATENYGAETDNKLWLLNSGRFVNQDSFTLDATDISNGYVDLTLPVSNEIAALSSGLGFLRKDTDGSEAITWYDNVNTQVMNIEVVAGSVAAANTFVYYDEGTYHRLFFPTGTAIAASDRLEAIYAANGYGTGTSNKYFEIMSDTSKADFVGAIRQGQVEIYIVADDATSYAISWRLTGCTITSDLTREPLAELGHLAPYDRPLTLPIPITVTVDSTAGDMENWAKISEKLTEFNADTLDDIDLADLMASEDLKLVVKVYAQTDEEAGGTYDNRKVAAGSDLIGQNYWVDGAMSTYAAAGEREYPLKTIIVEHIKITDEGMTLDMGANATQTFGFRSTNDLFAIKGEVSIGNITSGNKVRRKA